MSVAGPIVAVELAVNVSTVDELDADGLNDAVTPLGSPLTEKATLLENPPVVLTEIVDVILFACFNVIGFGEAESV